MALTVFAENMGFFHKGSNGKGIAPLDFCLSPPPPPAGPIPIPYVNMLQASDLAKGSKTVKIDGQPTALEDASYVSTSTGDEMGTQGGSVITHKTKGKGYFTLWSSTVLVEGKGVCRHGDPMGQNCASKPFGCFDYSAISKIDPKRGKDGSHKACGKYVRDPRTTTDKQRKNANKEGARCWQCRKSISDVRAKAAEDVADLAKTMSKDKLKKKKVYQIAHGSHSAMVADHQEPLKIAWYLGGCRKKKGFMDWARHESTTRSQCFFCSTEQATAVRNMTPKQIRDLYRDSKFGKDKNLTKIDAKRFNNWSDAALYAERMKILGKP